MSPILIERDCLFLFERNEIGQDIFDILSANDGLTLPFLLHPVVTGFQMKRRHNGIRVQSLCTDQTQTQFSGFVATCDAAKIRPNVAVVGLLRRRQGMASQTITFFSVDRCRAALLGIARFAGERFWDAITDPRFCEIKLSCVGRGGEPDRQSCSDH